MISNQKPGNEAVYGEDCFLKKCKMLFHSEVSCEV